jgi:hypothetical protein
MLKPDEEQSFFDRERDRLTGEIATVRAIFFFFNYSQAISSDGHVSVASSTFFFTLLSFLRDSKNYCRAAMS